MHQGQKCTSHGHLFPWISLVFFVPSTSYKTTDLTRWYKFVARFGQDSWFEIWALGYPFQNWVLEGKSSGALTHHPKIFDNSSDARYFPTGSSKVAPFHHEKGSSQRGGHKGYTWLESVPEVAGVILRTKPPLLRPVWKDYTITCARYWLNNQDFKSQCIPTEDK